MVETQKEKLMRLLKISEEEAEKRIAFEVSVSKLELLENDEDYMGE